MCIIVFYHCMVRMLQFGIGGSEKLVCGANWNWGQLGVSIFFIISGVALMYTYGDGEFNVAEYFKKRWLGIFPGYYIAFVGAFLILFYLNGTVNHNAENWTIILTVFGLDGWLAHQIPNFYLVGEWFLGCIILLYIIFPVLRWLVNKYPIRTAIIAIIYYILLVQFYNIEMRIDWNFITRIIDVMFGMYFVKYVKKVKWPVALLSIVVSAILWIVPIKGVENMYLITLGGISTFVFLVWFSRFLKGEIVSDGVKVLSKYSYSIFLVHHQVLARMMKKFVNIHLTIPEQVSLLLCVCIVIGIYAYIHNKITGKVVGYIRSKVDFFK